MADLELRVLTNISKEYNDMIKVIVYKEPRYFVKSTVTKRKREEVDDLHYRPKISSLQRTKTLVRDIVLCNDFDLFCTFTFDPKKVDSFSYPACWCKMSTWLHHQRNNSREQGVQFKYLIIPEQHKSGRWHFHALISGYTSTLKASDVYTDSLNRIYNITSFRSGFTTAVKINDKAGVSNYVTKYITKSFVKNFNQRRFACSYNLTRPKRQTNSNILFNTLPIFRRQVFEDRDSFQYIIYK